MVTQNKYVLFIEPFAEAMHPSQKIAGIAGKFILFYADTMKSESADDDPTTTYHFTCFHTLLYVVYFGRLQGIDNSEYEQRYDNTLQWNSH